MPSLTRKIQLGIVGDKEERDRVWKCLREGIENQNKAMNQYMSALYMASIEDISKEDRQELNRLYSRIAKSKKGSAYDLSIEFFPGLPTASDLKQKVSQDYWNAVKKGLLYGAISLPTYRKNNPLLVHVDYVRLRKLSKHGMGMYHNYNSHTEFLEHLHKTDLEIFIKFAGKVTWKLILGNPHKSRFLREELKQIFEENYHIQGSTIGIENNKIILNLCMDIPKKQTELKDGIIVGVDLGVKNTAVCALNDDSDFPNKSNFIGDGGMFIQQRNRMKKERGKIYSSIKYGSSGGHGRKRKLKTLDKFKKREKNFAKTYNHKVSKEIVDFAINNHASEIHMEDLSGFGKSDMKNPDKQKLLGVWGYYQLQQDITYKAAQYNIKVKKIESKYTSQTCSFCGERGERRTRDDFYCINDKCKKYECRLDADWNAARNIAFSTKFTIKSE